MLSWRTKLEKLLCLKYLGKRSPNSGGFQITKLLFEDDQETMASVEGSSTMSYVLLRNGGGIAFELGIGAIDVSGIEGIGASPIILNPKKLNLNFEIGGFWRVCQCARAVAVSRVRGDG